jgi:hypothetical protein
VDAADVEFVDVNEFCCLMGVVDVVMIWLFGVNAFVFK